MKPATLSRAWVLATSGALLATLALGAVAAAIPDLAKSTCAGKEATILGTEGADVIAGTMGRDVIVAGGGDDTISGRGGGDIICAGRDDDTVLGTRGADKLFGGPGADVLNGGMGRDMCATGAGTGSEVNCEVIARKDTEPDPTRTFQATCEGAGGTFHVTYPDTDTTPVCVFSPPIGAPEPWNTVFGSLAATCPSGSPGFGGDPSANPNWMGCAPVR
jgi:hypothetical protein